MRRLACMVVCVLLLTSGGGYAQQSPEDVMAAANAAYAEGDYTTAITLYSLIVEAGAATPELYYNLGSAYYEDDDLGRALVNFLRAARSLPRDRDVQVGIVLARVQRVDIQTDDSDVLDLVASATSGLLTLPELALVSFLAWIVIWVLVGGWVLRPFWRVHLRVPLLTGLIVGLLFCMLLGGRLYVEAARPQAVVTAFTVMAMSGPGDDYLPLYPLHSAAELRILESRAGWARYTLPDGRQGWLPQTAFERVDAPGFN